MRRTLLAFAVLAGTALVLPTSAAAAPATDNIQLFPLATRFFDSASTPLTPGVAQALTFGYPRVIANLGLSSVTQPTWVYAHPCGQPVDRSKPAAAFDEPGFNSVNLVPVNIGSCITMIGSARVTVDLVASQGPGAGAPYVELPESVEVPVSPTGTSTRVNLRVAGVPANATAAVVFAEVLAPERGSVDWMLTNCSGLDLGQRLVAGNDEYSDNLFIIPIDSVGDACFRSLTGQSPVEARIWVDGYLAPGAAPAPAGPRFVGTADQRQPGFVAVPPNRLFDTRQAAAPVQGGTIYRYRFNGLPADATAVAFNLTATQTGGAGFVSAYPCDAGQPPDVSNVNFTGANQTVPNFAIVSLGATQEICFFALTTTHLFADIAGYYVSGGGDGFVPAAPDRLFDTRTSLGRIPGGTVFTADLNGRVGADATAVVMNVTVTDPAAPGFVAAYPCDQPVPTASNVNYGVGETRPNSVTVKLPADKRVCFFTPSATHLLADLGGWYAPSSNIGFIGVKPFRVFDTREPAGSPPLEADSAISLNFPSPYLEALVYNLTATATQGPGFVTGFPCEQPTLPTASNVNFGAAGQTVANLAFLRPGSDGDLCFYTLTGTHLIADEAGFFVSPVPSTVPYEGTTVAAGAAIAHSAGSHSLQPANERSTSSRGAEASDHASHAHAR